MSEELNNMNDNWRLYPERAERWVPEGDFILAEAEGSSYDCGRYLGELWRSILISNDNMERITNMIISWLGACGDVKKLIEKYAPHLIDLRRGFAEGIGIPWEKYIKRSDGVPPQNSECEAGGCTSFGIHPDATVDGEPMSGQNKDTLRFIEHYIMMKLKQKNVPVLLALSYPWDLLGYGMSSSGFSVFRNSLFANPSCSGIPWDIFAEVFMYSNVTLDVVIEEAQRYGLSGTASFTMSDRKGRSAAFEVTSGGIGIVEGQDNIVVHANHVHSRNLIRHSNDTKAMRADSVHRQRRLTELFLSEYGRLTPQLVLKCLSDHHNYPCSICRHEADGTGWTTTASIVVLPAKGKMYITRGNPCMYWPKCYQID